MSYREEFPDFDPADMPQMPEGFLDQSWHNDVAPHFTHEGLMVDIWVDYADPARREWTGASKRFQIYRINDIGELVQQLLETDEWPEIVACIAAIEAMQKAD